MRTLPFVALLGLSGCYINPPVAQPQPMVQAPPSVVVEQPRQQPPVVVQQPAPQPPAVIYHGSPYGGY